jgi:uncharacterized protein YjbI with pentapeptide repeats
MSTLKTTNIQHPDSINPQIALTSASVTVNSILKLNSTVDFTSASITGLDLLPSQTGQSGKYLTTNGTVASWGVVDLSTKANINSPTFTGVPAAPTAAAGTNTTQLATTAFVTAADNLKANLSGATFTGVVTGVSPTAAGSIGFRRATISTSTPSGGLDGDVWYRYA